MTTITIDELRERLDEVFDQLAHGGEPIEVTRDSTVVARIGPPTAKDLAAPEEPVAPSTATASTVEAQSPLHDDPDPVLAAWGRVSALIGDSWPEGVSAVDAIREDRRG